MTYFQSAFGDLEDTDAFDGSDPGLDMATVTQALNAMNPMSHAQAHAIMGWALNMLHSAYGFSVTGIGTAKQQLTTALDNARYDLEGLNATIDGDPDPLRDGEAAAVHDAVVRGVLAYNQGAQAASDSAANTKLLLQDLKDNVAAVSHAIGAGVSNTVGGVLGGLFSNPWMIGVAVVAGGALLYSLTRKPKKGT